MRIIRKKEPLTFLTDRGDRKWEESRAVPGFTLVNLKEQFREEVIMTAN